MAALTSKQITSIEHTFNALFTGGAHAHQEVLVTGTPAEFCVEISRQYNRLELTFAHLKQISDFFGTDSIDVGNGRSDVGCDTCDYGSSYGVVITVKNATVGMS